MNQGLFDYLYPHRPSAFNDGLVGGEEPALSEHRMLTPVSSSIAVIRVTMALCLALGRPGWTGPTHVAEDGTACETCTGPWVNQKAN